MEDETIKTLRKLNRERIHSIWEIAKNGNLDILTGEERRYAEVMLEHEEEYFNQFEMADLTYEHQYELDTDENPFLHITLHVVVENQLQAGEPIEVYQFYNSMRKKKSSHHDAIHLRAAILAPLIVIALQRNVAPDVELYKSLLRKYKGKTQSSLEKAYELDKMYNEAGPMLALGRFWAALPWPYKDRKKALRFYREYQKTRYFNEKAEGKVYLAELLLELKGKGNKEEAKALLEKASQSDEKYFRDWARRLLK